MVIIITLFYISLFTIISMVVWKMVTLRGLKLSLVEGVEKELHGKFYETVHEWWHVLRSKYFVRVRTFSVSLFYVIAHEVLRYAIIIGRKFGARFHVWYDLVKGKRVLHKKGAVSSHLRNIAEHKKQLTADDSRPTTDN